MPVLGLIFLCYADIKFSRIKACLEGTAPAFASRRRTSGPDTYKAEGAIYLQPAAQFKSLVELPEGENIGQRINEAMKLIEADNRKLDSASRSRSCAGPSTASCSKWFG